MPHPGFAVPSSGGADLIDERIITAVPPLPGVGVPPFGLLTMTLEFDLVYQ